MLRNYLKIAWRNLKRHKIYTSINIIGLAVALAACLIIALYVRYELSYDKFFPNAGRTYRIVMHSKDGGGSAITPPGLAHAVAVRFPEIKHATVIIKHRRKSLLTANGHQFYTKGIFYADSSFLNVFPYKMIRGNPRKALTGPHKMVITQTLAHKLFGNENPVGQIIRYGNRTNYTVTGVIKDPPHNEHFRPNVLISFLKYLKKRRYGKSVIWRVSMGYTYITLRRDSNPKALQKKINAFKASHTKSLAHSKLVLQPVTAIHLHSHLSQGIAPQSDIKYLYIFSAIGLILLIIACINYVNLSTARALQRNTEVGIRKVVGSRRSQLMGQFLGESALIILLALPITVILVRFAFPLIHRLTGLKIILWTQFGGLEWLIFIGILLFVGILAGLYPAIYLSGLRPSQIFGGQGRFRKTRRQGLQKGLVVFQFAASITLIIITLIVQSQLGYIQKKDLGFNDSRVITFNSGHLRRKYEPFKKALQKYPSIVSVTSGEPPGLGKHSFVYILTSKDAAGVKPNSVKRLNIFMVDHNYLKTLKIHLKSGRDFSHAQASDSAKVVILNKIAANYFFPGQSPIGKAINLKRFSSSSMKVIGEFENLYNSSLFNAKVPMMILFRPANNRTAIVRLAPGSVKAGIAAIAKTWKKFMPNRPFDYRFLSDQIQAQYLAEQRLAHIFWIFAGLTILVACLGLFGLASFIAQNRTKEIGIRKVMGATAANIVGLLSKDFLKLVFIGFVIAVPIAWFFMHRWLQNFAYKIHLSPWMFILPGAIALFIALATVSWQSVKVALENPVDSLRSE